VRDVIPQKCSIRIQVAAAAALAINSFTKDKSCDWCVHFQLLERISSGLRVDDGVSTPTHCQELMESVGGLVKAPCHCDS
jgi:hypothetical protein